MIYYDEPVWTVPELLSGTRAVTGLILMQSIYSVRAALFFFYLLFVLRLLLRHEWAAAFVFAALFGMLATLNSDHPGVDGVSTFLYFSMLAGAVLRWGLTTLAVAMFVGNLVLMVPATEGSFSSLDRAIAAVGERWAFVIWDAAIWADVIPLSSTRCAT